MLSFFPRDVLDEIWDLIGSVSESFSTYLLLDSDFFTKSTHGSSALDVAYGSHFKLL